ncbi:MAG: hypothetical protein L6R41_006010 [Letrouitia leprolyta]|nr:MAG: hypothetical protein L6R41_006010 [Letrouitia leprolyta]
MNGDFSSQPHAGMLLLLAKTFLCKNQHLYHPLLSNSFLLPHHPPLLTPAFPSPSNNLVLSPTPSPFSLPRNCNSLSLINTLSSSSSSSSSTITSS